MVSGEKSLEDLELFDPIWPSPSPPGWSDPFQVSIMIPTTR